MRDDELRGNAGLPDELTRLKRDLSRWRRLGILGAVFGLLAILGSSAVVLRPDLATFSVRSASHRYVNVPEDGRTTAEFYYLWESAAAQRTCSIARLEQAHHDVLRAQLGDVSPSPRPEVCTNASVQLNQGTEVEVLTPSAECGTETKDGRPLFTKVRVVMGEHRGSIGCFRSDWLNDSPN